MWEYTWKCFICYERKYYYLIVLNFFWDKLEYELMNEWISWSYLVFEKIVYKYLLINEFIYRLFNKLFRFIDEEI